MDCGLVFISPRWDKNDLKNWYEDPDYWPSVYPGRAYTDDPFDYEDFCKTGAYKINRMKLDLVKKYQSRGRILDIGCGPGLFLYMAKKDGFSVLGVELSERMAGWGIKHLGIDVKIDYLENLDLQKGYFDVIMMWDVLEHLSDPLLYLKTAAKIMHPDACIFGQVPNYDGWVNRFKTWTNRMGIRKKKWSHFGLPQHIYWYTPKTLSLLFEKAGLEMVAVQSWSHLKYKVKTNPFEVYFNKLLEKCNRTSYFVFTGKLKKPSV
jgi:SAM-dependent methyltransferase